MLNCVDLFAGAGGFSLAAQLAGLKVLLAVESDKHAAATYRANICKVSPDTQLIDDDIRQVDIANVIKNELNQKQCHLLLGGPPCQGFSTHRIKDSGVNDERNDLVHVYFDFVRALQPHAFLMENVPGMLWDRHKATVSRLYQEGAAAGYYMLAPTILDARQYGLPQRRKRVFILGLRKDLSVRDIAWPPQATHGSTAECLSDPHLQPWTSCHAAFHPARAGDINDIHMRHSDELVNAFARTPANGGSRTSSGRELKCHKGHDGHNDVYGRIDPRLPAPTMTTACINPSKGRFVHPTEHHGITVRQAARIQTFPDNFTFEGGLMAAGKQVGNAVPVALGKMLIEGLIPFIGNRPSDKR